MTLRTLCFSAAILLSTATAAVAAPERSNRDHDRIDARDGWRPVKVRDHRTQPAPRVRAWADLGTMRAAGKRTTLTFARATAADQLRLSVQTGSVQVKKVIITFGDGSRYVAPVRERLSAGQPEVIQIPGNKRVASVELRLGNIKGKGRNARVARIAIAAR